MRRLFIMRKGLAMTPGKLAAQVAHCAEAYWTRQILKNAVRQDERPIYVSPVETDAAIYEEYLCGMYVKTICEARNKNHLLKAKESALALGFVENVDFGLIYDKCLTELEPEEEDGTTLTGIWFKPLPDDVAHEISRKYQLYK